MMVKSQEGMLQTFEKLLNRGLELKLYRQLSEKPTGVIFTVIYQYCEPRLQLRWRDTSTHSLSKNTYQLGISGL